MLLGTLYKLGKALDTNNIIVTREPSQPVMLPRRSYRTAVSLIAAWAR